MDKAQKIQQFDPNGVGLDNGHFIGLPFEEEDAQLVLLPVPWDVTTSYQDGTSTGPANILQASTQLDLMDPDVPDAWKLGLYFRPPSAQWLAKNDHWRKQAVEYIRFLEQGGDLHQAPAMQNQLSQINAACGELKEWVYQSAKAILDNGQKVGIVGGEHSVPLGYLEALAERYMDFGVLQLDAHFDLREAYEGFTHSHASIFYNAQQLEAIKCMVHVGIRDYCEAEARLVERSTRHTVFYQQELQRRQFRGEAFAHLVEEMIAPLPHRVYVSFDIDALQPSLCPHTGTPVPDGLGFEEALFIIKRVVDSGREIIGFDLCEVAGLGHEWDGSVGARVLYRLANLVMGSGLEDY